MNFREDSSSECLAEKSKEGFTASDHVRHTLRPLLQFGQPSIGEVASRLGLHPRTLERRLEQENTRFEILKDGVRLAMSRELLAFTDLTSSDIAATVGYATPSAFLRAFRRWTGQAPGSWRRACRQKAIGNPSSALD